MSTALRRLPSIDRLLQSPDLRAFATEYPHDRIVAAARAVLAEVRTAVQSGAVAPDLSELADRVRRTVLAALRPSLRPVVNATGVIIHTNLGRAPLSAASLEAMAAAGAGYSNLEYDLLPGDRGSRHGHLRGVLRDLTGAEDAVAVNNNAAAVLLALSALAAGREVIVSRGEAVEIGGGFRIPDVLAQSGARLVEVGTTNRTYVRDYAAALTEHTAAILRVHTSNFRVIGFVHQPGLAELAALARERGIALIDDLGSGCLIDPRPFGLHGEPLVQESVAAGASLVCFSGDKLLGGPQAGLIVGATAFVEPVRRHPLMRALRPDKTAIAGLAATLRHYQLGEAIQTIPIWQMIAARADDLATRAHAWQAALGAGEVIAVRSTVGGGSLPEETLPSFALALDPPAGAGHLAALLRRQDPPVIARIEDGRVVLDVRTVLPNQDEPVVSALRAAATRRPDDRP